MHITKEMVLSAERCTGMQASYSNEEVTTIHVVPAGDYEQPVLCFDCGERCWRPKSQDSYWSYWDSMLMLSLMQFYENDEALAILEEMDAFTCPCFGFDDEESSEKETDNDFLAALDAVLKQYSEQNNIKTYNKVLEFILDGIRDNAKLKVPFYLDAENYDTAPSAIEYDDGSSTLVLLTNPEEEDNYAVPIRLRSLLSEMDRRENCDGLIINPDAESFFLPKALIKSAIAAGYQIAMDEIEEEAKMLATADGEKELVLKRPIQEEEFTKIENRINELENDPSDFLKINFLHDDDLLYAQVLRTDESENIRLSFGFDMDDFGWDKPLVLGKVLSVEKTIEILRRVCVDGIEPSPNKIKELKEFAQIE